MRPEINRRILPLSGGKSDLRSGQRKNAHSLPDANSRMQAVIAGNGLGMQDAFAEAEIESGRLVWMSDIAISNFADCFVQPEKPTASPATEVFKTWITAQGE